MRKQWVTKIGRKNWNPSKHTKICSDHFNKEDFFVTAKGFRKIKIGAMPCLKLDISESDSFNVSGVLDSDTSKSQSQCNQDDYINKIRGIRIGTLQSRIQRLLKKNASLHQMVKSLQSELNGAKQDREIKMLRKRNLRLQEKNASLISIIKKIKRSTKNRQQESPGPIPVCEVCGTSRL